MSNQKNQGAGGGAMTGDAAKKMKDLEKRVEILESMNSSAMSLDHLDGATLDTGKILEMMKNIQKELLQKMVTTSQLENVNTQIENIYKELQVHSSNINEIDEKNRDLNQEINQDHINIANINEQIEEIKRQIEEMDKKVTGKLDCDLFDEEISTIKDIISSGASSGGDIVDPAAQATMVAKMQNLNNSGPKIDNKEMNKLKDAANKVYELEEKVLRM